ncbi:AsmA family protein [Chitinophaga sedimenti]|uniref:AsmA family protein n=1 Tax=Chitinophaga sedimenti TaxID=2033606 RepID=UPI0020058CAB|nr:AsmA family protein [Chitinophaga sedimenti]MCK7554134.1 AsmA family protein [Chitinophaga sedimenti]
MPVANRLRKRIIRGLLITIGTFVALIAMAAIVLFTQQQRLTNLAVTELNKQFKGELTLEKSNISLFKNFPYVSIGLHGVRFYDNKKRNGKPIYQVEHAYAGFSLPDIFKGKYNVRRMMLRGGYLELVRSRDGQLNIIEAKNLAADTTTAPAADTSDRRSI